MSTPDEAFTATSPMRGDEPGWNPGLRLANLEILEPLGRGSFGEVYRAIDLRLGREVAIKRITRPFPQHQVSYQQEARALAALNHPNVVTIHDVGEAGRQPYIVMELLRGQTLRAAMAEPFALAECLLWVRDLLRGLAAVHKAGLVHLDIKPENLFVSSDARLVLLDFGVARFIDAPDATEASTITGTVAYMAPEQLRGQVVDARTDLFAVGVLLHELVLGCHPFKRDGLEATAQAIQASPPDARGRTWPDALLAEVIMRCLAKDPRLRPASAEQLQEELAPFIEARIGGVITEVGHVETDLGQQAYRVFGQGVQDVLLVPGMLSHVDMWMHGNEGGALMRGLSRGRRIVVPDRCGRGASDRLPEGILPSLEDEVAQLAAIMDATAMRRAVVVALDEGCSVGMALAALRPDRIAGLVLVDPCSLREPARGQARVDAWGTGSWLEPRAAPAPVRSWLAAWERMSCPRSVAAGALDRLARLDLAALARVVAVRTWIVRGVADGATPEPASLCAALADGHLHDLPGSTLFPPLLDAGGLTKLVAAAAVAAPVATPDYFIAVDRARGRLGVRARALCADERPGWSLLQHGHPGQAVRLARAVAQDEQGRARIVVVGARDLDSAWRAVDAALPVEPGDAVLARDVEALLEALNPAPRSLGLAEKASRSLADVAAFESRAFRIEVTGSLRLRLMGNLNLKDTTHVVVGHLRAIHAAALGCGVLTLDLRLLRHMNSTALGVLIQWASWIRAEQPSQRYRLALVTDRSVLWQRASLPALAALAPDVLEFQ